MRFQSLFCQKDTLFSKIIFKKNFKGEKISSQSVIDFSDSTKMFTSLSPVRLNLQKNQLHQSLQPNIPVTEKALLLLVSPELL